MLAACKETAALCSRTPERTQAKGRGPESPGLDAPTATPTAFKKNCVAFALSVPWNLVAGKSYTVHSCHGLKKAVGTLDEPDLCQHGTVFGG